MPQIHRRRSRPIGRRPMNGYAIPPMMGRPTRLRWIVRMRRTFRHVPGRLVLLAGAVVLALALVVTGVSLLAKRSGTSPVNLHSGGSVKPQLRATNPSVALPQRATANPVPAVTPESNPCRDISPGAKDIQFQEKQINQPAIYDKELFFSAGTGSLDSDGVLKKLYLYNLDTNKERKVADSKIKSGEFYETQMNDNWLVWLETDHHTFNYIYVQARKDDKGKPTDNGKVTLIKNCKNGKPKLKLSGNTLVWMEQVDKDDDQLIMFDLTTQDNLTLFSFKDVATYGVSAPSVYEDTSKGGSDKTTIVWAGPDPKQTADQAKAQGAHSAIYWLDLGENAITADGKVNSKSFVTGTYVHEPLYNGKYFVWIDGNYSPNSKLYLSAPNGKPKVIAEGVTTYGLGDGIVVFGMQQQVWVYVIDTGELCRLTGANEKGMLPNVSGRTVAWYDLSADSSKDTIKYKVLTDADLHLGKAK